MSLTKDDWCGVGYHCGDDEIAEDCFLKASVAGFGFNSLSKLWDPVQDKALNASGSILVSWFGHKWGNIFLKTLGEGFGYYGVYDFGKEFYRTAGECYDVERGGKNYGWTR